MVRNLKAPRKDCTLRDIDDLFFKSLITEFKDNEVFFGLKPLLAVVKGLTAPADFKEELLALMS